MRFELTVLRICNPLHWASLPPHHIKQDPLFSQIKSLIFEVCCMDPKTGVAAGIRTQITSSEWKMYAERNLDRFTF